MKVTKEMGMILKETTLTSRNPIALDITKEPFRLYGSFCGGLIRVPAEITEKAADNPRLAIQATRPAGMRVRFQTDSDYIAIHADYSDHEKNVFTPEFSTCSFDMYVMKDGKQHFAGAFIPSQGEGKRFVECRLDTEAGMKDVILYFPISATLEKAAVILREGSEIDYGSEYRPLLPVVFYGSSIVHGCGACKPSMAYPAQVSRMLNVDFYNLGFGGAAKCEPEMMDYITKIPMSVFVYDYDHNAPDAAYLAATHERGYRQFREKKPETPIIFASKPDYEYGDIEENEKRRQIVRATYEKAKAEGDHHVYYIDGLTFYPEEFREHCTSDGLHPNDVGYYFMARKFAEIIEKIIQSR